MLNAAVTDDFTSFIWQALLKIGREKNHREMILVDIHINAIEIKKRPFGLSARPTRRL